MNSAVKPAIASAVPQSGQASPAKANVAGVNHAGHPQGAQNSLHHTGNNLVGQNLTQHVPAAAPPAHAAPSLAPVSANMAQMAHNMSHHGNLSHVGQNSVPPPAPPAAASPAKPGAPLSLVADKVTPSQPLALTRTPEKKEPEANAAQANGTVDSPKAASNPPPALKPQNPEPNKDKLDIAKTSPSTPKPPEKPITPQKAEANNSIGQADGSVQPKVASVATANEPPEKSPSKPSEPKPTPTADVAPTQTEPKPAPESANDASEKPVKKVEELKAEDKVEPAKVEEKKEEPKPENPVVAVEEKKSEPVVEKKEEKVEVPEVVEEKKPEPAKTPVAKANEPKPVKSTMKLATVTPPVRKRRQTSPSKTNDTPASTKKVADGDNTPDSRSKRNRTQVQLYQSPTPELTMATKLSASAGRATPPKANDDKLIVFYKNEYLAVRNAEGGFYVCQSTQNVYRTTRRIKIRWLSQDKQADPSGQLYKPDFYDFTDMECVLTTLSMSRAGPGGAQILKEGEAARARSILERALLHEKGDHQQLLTEEHPDGLDLSLYKDESQLEKKLQKKSRKRKSGAKSSSAGKHQDSDSDDDDDEEPESPSPSRKSRTASKSPRRARKTAAKPSPAPSPAKRRPPAAPAVPAPSKTATTVTEKPSPKTSRAKRAPPTPVKAATAPAKAATTPAKTATTPAKTPKGKPKRNVRESKPSPLVPTPSTSTGKTTRTPRKPPAHK